MPETNKLSVWIYLAAGVVAVLFLIGMVVVLGVYINDFTRELKFLNNEIARTTGAERRHWIRLRRRLWLSLIPFVKY